MKKFIEFYSKGTTQQVIIRIVITLVIIVILYYALKKLTEALKQRASKREQEQAVTDTTGGFQDDTGGYSGFADGSSMSELEANQFSSQAQLIADQQYQAMSGAATDEDALFNTLLPLNGAKMNLVLEKFGVREGKNLFQWYADELCEGGLFAPCTSLTYYDESTPECDSWFNGCSELPYMRAIWKKWSNTLPF